MDMRSRYSLSIFFCAALLITATENLPACTNILVTKGASEDGSVIITYACDGEFHPILQYTPAADYGPDDSLEIRDWYGNFKGKIKQASHTYAYIRLMNEYQLTIGETTFDGRKELQTPDAVLHYWDLMVLALQRAKTAREAIKVMTELVAEYGYRSTGETFSIADPEEAWILEMIGPGAGGTGAVWVAVKIPDGMISAHANRARIGEFPLHDPANCLYSENVISLAVEKGYYNPESGQPFRFCDVYCPPTPKNRRYAEARVWSIFRRAAPSLNLSPDYHRAVEGAEPYPLWLKPDKKLTVSDVFALMRDHYEGTEFDMTVGIDAGPFGNPNRWRPIYWTVDSVEYMWERPISTQQTGFSMVSQARSWLPDPVGGVLWYGIDDTYFTCYFPLYCGINAVPESYATGSLSRFSWDSAWWVFNFVANYANLKYSYIKEDILAVQSELETDFTTMQSAVDAAAAALYHVDQDLMTEYLTDYSVTQGEKVVKRWRDLAEDLIRKYNDGYVQDEEGNPQEVGYPESWLREVLKSRPESFKLKEKEEDTPESELVD